MEVEKEQELGGNGLLREDIFSLEIKLDDLETSSGEQEEYWLLEVRAARNACVLRAQQNQTIRVEEIEKGIFIDYMSCTRGTD